MELIKILNRIQKELKAPKNQFNKFGNYNYRNCEDILEAVKPLLPESVVLTITDEIVNIGDRYYIKATATIRDDTDAITGIAFAREALDRKGMDDSQITGSASSYARKYALNGLFLIDDTEDADTRAPVDDKPPASGSKSGQIPSPQSQPYPQQPQQLNKPKPTGKFISEPMRKKMLAMGKTVYEIGHDDIVLLYETIYNRELPKDAEGKKHLASISMGEGINFIDKLVDRPAEIYQILRPDNTGTEQDLPF